MRSLKKQAFGLIGAVSVLFLSCVTMSDYNFNNIDKSIKNGMYDAVYEELCNPQGVLYTSSDLVLENLDKGLISHYAGEYERSNGELSEAETLIRSYYSKSITQAAASMLVNDTVIDYAGDPFEDVYTNIFMALNYLQLGKFDDAFVEIRRFDIKLKEIQQKYQAQLEKQKKELKDNSVSVPSGEVKFHNSALARYLSLLIYRTEGDYDSARVDYNMMHDAFRLQPSLYDFPFPESVKEELTFVPDGFGRLNILAFSGLSPVKVEESIPLYAYDGFYRIALPVMEKRKSSVAAASVTAVNVETGEVYSAHTQKIESIEDIAVDTYAQKYAAIVGKTVARMVSKLVATAALDTVAEEADDSAVSMIFSILGAASKINMFVSERADVRTCRYFPASAYAAGITLPEGRYDITVVFKTSSDGKVETLEYNGVSVSKSGLNLVESYCFK